jgi:hypothetical protein
MKNTNKNFNITPEWISGFTQSDGSFVISFMNTKIGIPIRPLPIFNITQSKIEFYLFIEIEIQTNKKLGIWLLPWPLAIGLPKARESL